MKLHHAIRTFAAVLLCCAALPALAAEAYVSLAGPGGSVSQFRDIGGAPIRTLSTPPGAVDLLLSPEESKLYIGTTTTAQNDVQGGSPSLVAVLDGTTGAVIKTYPMPGSVVKMVRDTAGRHVYATGILAAGDVVVMSLDTLSGATSASPVPGASPFHLYPIGISPDGTSLFVPAGNAVTIFDAATLAVTGTIPLTSSVVVAPPLVTPDGKTLLVVGGNVVSLIDIATRTVAHTVTIATSAVAFGDALSPDGKTCYVSAGTLTAIDVATHTIKGSVALGQTNPYRLGISPDGSTLYSTDLTYGTTLVIDAATLATRHTLRSIAPPYAIVVKSNGNAVILNENSNRVARVDTASLTTQTGFAVGDAPQAGVLAAGKVFIPEVANVAVQRTPDAPTPARPIADNLIIASSAAALGNKVYVNEGSLVRVINANLEIATGAIRVRVPANGGIGSALDIAASGDGRSLLASYEALEIDGPPVAGGIVKIDTTTGAQKPISSFPFIPGIVTSNRTGTASYALGFLSAAQVGVWDTANDVFVKSVVVPGGPSYVGLAAGADGSVLYVADQHGKVDLLDGATLQLLGSIATGGHPSGIAISADGKQALVTDGTSNTVIVVDLASGSVAGTVNVGGPSAGAVFLD
ncbi:MAG: hypothetical protein JSR59_17625 [Proteobacteria bacterium]|nr:hypothetical protein [Pseudomonadota bacterium]